MLRTRSRTEGGSNPNRFTCLHSCIINATPTMDVGTRNFPPTTVWSPCPSSGTRKSRSSSATSYTPFIIPLLIVRSSTTRYIWVVACKNSVLMMLRSSLGSRFLIWGYRWYVSGLHSRMDGLCTPGLCPHSSLRFFAGSMALVARLNADLRLSRRKVVRRPTWSSSFDVGAALKRSTAWCLSMTAPRCVLRRPLPSATTAHRSHLSAPVEYRFFPAIVSFTGTKSTSLHRDTANCGGRWLVQSLSCLHESGREPRLRITDERRWSRGLTPERRFCARMARLSTLQSRPLHPASHEHSLGAEQIPFLHPEREQSGRLQAVPCHPGLQVQGLGALLPSPPKMSSPNSPFSQWTWHVAPCHPSSHVHVPGSVHSPCRQAWSHMGCSHARPRQKRGHMHLPGRRHRPLSQAGSHTGVVQLSPLHPVSHMHCVFPFSSSGRLRVSVS
mmetsp:Transcript_43729/g.139397  ORF Transcript_43729/g.139397 Transcript_43729/m.139397 type:complete len:442 (+) Transcript_43729:416-1741(+)